MATGHLEISTALKVRVARLLSLLLRGARRLVGKGRIGQFQRNGCNWELDLGEGVDLAVYLGVYEPHISKALSDLIKPGFVVLDVGANIGAQTLPIARLVGSSGKVIAVEPTAFAFSKLRKNLSLNQGFEDITATLQALLTDSVDQIPDEIPSSWPVSGSHSDLHPTHKGLAKTTQGARPLMLDTLVDELNIDRLDFIKIDVDGFELEVLRGGQRTMEELRPRMIIEVAPHVHENRPGGFPGFLEFLRSIPYDAFYLDASKPISLTADSFVHGQSIDVLFMPRSR